MGRKFDGIVEGLKKALFSETAKFFLRNIGWLVGFVLWLLADQLAPTAALNKEGHLTLASSAAWLNSIFGGRLDPTVSLVVVLCVAFTVAFLIVVISLAVSALVRTGISSYKRRQLVQRVGLSGYWPDAKADENSDAWLALRNHIYSQGNSTLYILGATGLDTFGKRGSPLWQSVDEFKGEIRVILLAPDSKHLPLRAKSVGMSEIQYREQISMAINQLTEWKAQGHRVRHYLYDALPNWKILLTSKLVWVQYYRPHQNVQDTPVYQFYATENRFGIHEAFRVEFLRIWDCCEADGRQ